MDVYLSRKSSSRSIVLGASILLNIVLLALLLWPEQTPTEPAASAEPVVLAAAEPAPSIVDEEPEIVEPTPASEGEAMARATETETETETQIQAVKDTNQQDDVQVTIASLRGSIPQTMATAVGALGDNVSATLSRVLFWDLDLRRVLRAVDKVEVMWTPGTSDGVVIQAARYHSQKLNRTITAYRFQAKGDRYPSYWSADGIEVPHRLRKSPLAEYEQVTSLLRDRPTHHGMDFKVDVGTPIVTPFDGVVTRVNWNVAANGYCVEIQHNDGVLAKYLHLSETKVKQGARVRAGQTIALSGNTGRSTGPHLHYQLNRGTAVVDPIDYHGTDRRTLPEADRPAFNKVVTTANARLDAAGKQASQ